MRTLDDVVSVSLGMACAFLILGMAGCTTLSTEEIRDVVVAKREQLKKEHCECPPPSVVVIINEDN